MAAFVAAKRDDRMDDRLDSKPAPAQLHTDRVDQERHVVGDYLDRRMAGLPAFDFKLRIDNPDLAGSRHPLAREVQVRQSGSVEVEPALALEVLGRYPAVVLPDEFLGLSSVRLRQMLVEPGAHAIDKSLVERLDTSLRALRRSRRMCAPGGRGRQVPSLTP